MIRHFLALLLLAVALWTPHGVLDAAVVDWEGLPVPHATPWPEAVEALALGPNGDLWAVSHRRDIYTFPYEYVFRSADCGDTWTSATVRGGAAVGGFYLASLGVDMNGTVWFGNDGGLFGYHPAEDIWTTTTVQPPVIRLKRLLDERVYASGAGFFRYDSLAGTWVLLSGGEWNSDITITPAGVLYVADLFAKMSTDGGATWQTLFRLWGPRNLASFDTHSFAGASPAGSVFMANHWGLTFPPHFYRLPPGGQTWESPLPGIDPWSSVVSSADGILACSLRAASGVLSVYASADDGARWTPLPCVLGEPSVGGITGPSMSTLVMSTDGTIYAGFQGYLARFRTGGAYALSAQAGPGGAIGELPSGTFYTAGSTVTLTATPSGAYVFTGWEGDTGLTTGTAATTNPIVVVMDRHRFVRAHFSLRTFAVTALAGPGGTVTRQPDQALYDAGSAVTITASPDRGFRFRRWFGDIPLGRSLENPLVLTVDTTRTLTAQFGPNGSNWIMLR